MDWVQVLTIIGVLGSFMFFMLQRIEKYIDKLSNRLDGHAQRIDQLYSVILNMLEKKG